MNTRKYLKKTLLMAYRPFLPFIGYIAGEGFNSNDLPPLLLLKCLIIQKIIGINRKLTWPVHHGSEFLSPEKIVRGSRYPGLARYCFIDARNGILIGQNTWIGPHVSLISMDHKIDDLSSYQQDEPIVIGSNCWLCAYSIILPGVQIADNVIVAANSVVTKSCLKSHVLLAGNPAKIVKHYQ